MTDKAILSLNGQKPDYYRELQITILTLLWVTIQIRIDRIYRQIFTTPRTIFIE